LPPDATTELIGASCRVRFDKPLPVQFGKWVMRAAQGDLGTDCHRAPGQQRMAGDCRTFILAVWCSIRFSFDYCLAWWPAMRAALIDKTDRRHRRVNAAQWLGIDGDHLCRAVDWLPDGRGTGGRCGHGTGSTSVSWCCRR
jgi:hypothetical protein